MAGPGRTAAIARPALAALAALLVQAAAAGAGEWDFSGPVAAELRVFPEAPAFAGQEHVTASPSLWAEPELVYEWNRGGDRLTLVPFARLDAHDRNRSHADLRAASWLHLGEDWDLVVGIDKVFWGVAESRHLVDIVNQTDAVEDIDGEDKLGQPMVNLNLQREWGSLGFFVLPGFRARTFPDAAARLRGPAPIAGDDATFDSGAKRLHVDLALRWAHSIGDWDLGLSHFHGTSREPRLVPRLGPGGPVLVPHYDQIDQTGLEVQLTSGAWLWKLEALTRSGHGRRFAALVGGAEYTLYQVFDSDADLGLLAEYLYDGREGGRAPATFADDDLFLGARLALNDPQDSALLAGAVIDRTSGATALFVEAERRLGDRWKLELEARFFVNVPGRDPLRAIADDGFLTLRLARYF